MNSGENSAELLPYISSTKQHTDDCYFVALDCIAIWVLIGSEIGRIFRYSRFPENQAGREQGQWHSHRPVWDRPGH